MEINTLNGARILLLIKRQTKIYRRAYFIGLGSLGGILFLILYGNLFFSGSLETTKFISLTFPAMFIAGCMFSASFFDELNNPQKKSQFILLPASNIEKLLAAWIVTSIMYLASIITILYTINIITSILGVITAGTSFYMVNLFTPNAIKTYAAYMAIQPIFLVGALAFKKQNFIKSILVLIISFITLLIISFSIYYVFYNEIFTIMQYNSIYTGEYLKNMIGQGCKTVFQTLFWAVTGPFFLLVAYHKLKEREV